MHHGPLGLKSTWSKRFCARTLGDTIELSIVDADME